MLASRSMAAAIIALALLGPLALVVPGTPAPVRAALNAPLVLCLPGLAWMSLLRPVGLDLATRLTLSVACTLVLVIFTGLVLNVTSDGLSTPAWTLSLGTLTLVPAVLRLCTGDSPGGCRPMPARALLLALPWAAALVGLALAYGLALQSATERRDPGFTQLWLAGGHRGCADQVRVGVASFEREPVDFRLTVLVDEEPIAERHWPDVAPDQRVEAILTTDRPAGRVVEARLFRSDRPIGPYRWARLSCDGNAASTEPALP